MGTPPVMVDTLYEDQGIKARPRNPGIGPKSQANPLLVFGVNRYAMLLGFPDKWLVFVRENPLERMIWGV